jgi:F-type H+-transporting ATPase subunit b
MLSSSLFWVALSFVIFMAIVGYYGLRPILQSLDARAERIRTEIREAEQLRQDAQQQLQDAKRKQREASQQAQEIVEHAKAESKRMQEHAEKDIQAQLERRERQTKDRIQQAEQQAIQEVRDRAVDIATAATAQLLKDNLSDKKANELVDSTIQELPKRLN